MSLNKVMLIGKLGQDPDGRTTTNGSRVVTVSLATDNYHKGQEKTTEWHRVVFWNKQAEIVEQYCKKGSQIFVEGSLQTNTWDDKDGNKRYTTQVVAFNIQMLGSKSVAKKPQSTAENSQFTTEDDIPF